MAVVVKEGKNSYAYLDDEEDALLNEAICCSRNLEIKTDDDEDDNDIVRKNLIINQKNNEMHKKQKSNIPWCDMDSDTTVSDLSTSNGKIDLSTSGEKMELSISNGKLENDKSLKDHANSKTVEILETKEIQHKINAKDTERMMDANNTENISPMRKRIREGEENDNEMKVSRNRRSSTSSSSTMSNNSKKSLEYETDPIILARRQKDIDYGKNTIGYDRYTQEITKDKRTKDHPRTPPMYTKYSRRGWDGMVKLWRKQLHFWDPKEEKQDENNKS